MFVELRVSGSDFPPPNPENVLFFDFWGWSEKKKGFNFLVVNR